nr:hypothetical protein [Tanacetum cinerariifolium]
RTRLPVLVLESLHEQTNEQLIETDIKQMYSDDQAIQTILLGLPKDVYAAADSCETAKEIWERVCQMMKVRQTKNLYEADFTHIYDFLKMNQEENQKGFNAWQNGGIQGAQNAGVQSVGDQNGLVVVPGIANQNGTGNVVTARAEGIQLQAEKFDFMAAVGNLDEIEEEEAGIQLQAENFDFMAAVGNLDEIEEVNANCILMANLQQASTSGTQHDRAPVYDTNGSAERKRSARVHQKKSTEDRLKFLENAINEIYEYDASSYSYKKLYRNADYLVRHNSGGKLYIKIVSTVTSHIKQMAASIEASQGSLFLEELNKRWMEHEKAFDILRWIFICMDSTCIPSTHEAGVQMLGITLWEAENCLDGEIKRVSDYLPVVHFYINLKSVEMITSVGEKEMIESHMLELIQIEKSGLVNMIVDDKYDDLARMYNLEAENCLDGEIKRVFYINLKSVEMITSVVEKEMIESHMLELIQMEKSGLVNMIVDDKFKGPVDFVQRLLDEKDKYDKIINLAFKADMEFQNALNSSFEYFINLNPRSPEFISLFVDDKLRKAELVIEEDNWVIVLDRVAILVCYLQDKGLFKKYFKHQLAERTWCTRFLNRVLAISINEDHHLQPSSRNQEAVERCLQSLACAAEEEKNVLRKEPISIHINEDDVFTVNEMFSSKCYKVKVGNGTVGVANLESEPDSKKWCRLEKDKKQQIDALISDMAGSGTEAAHKEQDPGKLVMVQNLKNQTHDQECIYTVNETVTISTHINEDDVFTVNEMFSSKCYKVKVGNGTVGVTNMESEQEKQETVQTVEDRKQQIDALISNMAGSGAVSRGGKKAAD